MKKHISTLIILFTVSLLHGMSKETKKKKIATWPPSSKSKVSHAGKKKHKDSPPAPPMRRESHSGFTPKLTRDDMALEIELDSLVDDIFNESIRQSQLSREKQIASILSNETISPEHKYLAVATMSGKPLPIYKRQ